MRKFLATLLIVITYFTTAGGCRAANAMPVEITYFTITNDIGAHIKNLTPPEKSAMPVDNFVFGFDVVPLTPGGYIPTPEITCLIGVMTVTTTPLLGEEGNHISIKIDGLNPGQTITTKIDDK